MNRRIVPVSMPQTMTAGDSMPSERAPLRILIGKPGLDGHDRGAKYVAQILRDAGFEVIYTGIRRTPEEIVRTAIQEDVQAIGISLLSGAHEVLVTRILELLKGHGISDMMVFVGGTIPAADADRLRAAGVDEVFFPGTPADEIVHSIRKRFNERNSSRA